MDRNSDKLQQNYDSAFLALLMDEYAEKLGEQVLQEYEHAGDDEDTDDSIDAMCYQIIRDSKPIRDNGRRIKKAFRRVGIVAAVIAVLFAMLICVQAAGIDVFGALANWTNSVFRFGTGASEVLETTMIDPELHDLLNALEEAGIPTRLAPTKLPSGFTLSSITDISNERLHGLIAVFENNSIDYLTLELYEYEDETPLEDYFVEKDTDKPEVYVFGEKSFYILSNMGKWGATWSDGKYLLHFSGFPTIEDLYYVIDSIMEDKNE